MATTHEVASQSWARIEAEASTLRRIIAARAKTSPYDTKILAADGSVRFKGWELDRCALFGLVLLNHGGVAAWDGDGRNTTSPVVELSPDTLYFEPATSAASTLGNYTLTQVCTAIQQRKRDIKGEAQ